MTLEKRPKMNLNITIGDNTMKEEYDLSTMKSRPNSYAKRSRVRPHKENKT